MATDKDIKFTLSAADRTAAVFRGVQGRLDGLDRTAGALNNSFGRVAGVLGGAFAGASLTAFVGLVAKGLDALVDLRDATGASVENISALEDIAARTGTSFDGMATSLVKFNKVLADAAPGSNFDKILSSIGLNAKELRTLDPAEALRRTAVALGQYADDGNKARIVQELFGKSVREVGPFLAELASQTQLVGTVTAQQAEEAEKFNKALLGMQKNALDLARNLTKDLIPAITNLFASVNASLELSPLEKTAKASSAAITQLTADLERYQYAADRGDKLAAGRIAETTRQLAAARAEQAKASAAIKAATNRIAGDPLRAAEDRGFVPNRASAPGLPDPAAAKQAAELAKRIAEAQATINEQMSKALVEAAEAMVQADEKAAAELAKVLSEAAGKRADSVAEAFRRGELESTDEVNKALKESQEKRAQQLSEFALQARRNLQDAVGDTLLEGLEGDFDNIERLWGNLLKRMVAQALAAQLNQALFGKTGLGSDTGSLGGLFALFGVASFDKGIDRVPRDMVAMVHQGERIVPAEQNKPGAGGVSITSAPQIYIDSRSDRADVARLVHSATEASNKALIDQLRASGALN